MSGLLLALAALIKLYPAFLLGYYFCRRSGRILGWTCVTGAILSAGTVLVYGLQPYQAYVHNVLLGHFYPYAADFNISLIGFTQRLFTPSRFAIPLFNAPGVAQALVVTGSLAIGGICIWSTREQQEPYEGNLAWSVWLLGMLLLSPVSGYYNLVVLLLPLLVALQQLEQRPDPQISGWLIGAGVLVCLPPGLPLTEPLSRWLHTRWGLLLAPAFYGLVIYLIVFAALARRSAGLDGRAPYAAPPTTFAA